MSTRFEIGDEDFLLDGQPLRILSGAIHYFRVHPDLWADRIHKARLMGLNTIETYVPWNLHAPDPGTWTTAGGLDLDRFLAMIAAEGMHAIVRPGPYICAELDNGGLPPWLFADPTVGIRTLEPTYMRHVGEYLDRINAIIAPHQIDSGGPVILVQVENEYGAYGEDHDYLRALTQRIKDAGITVPLTTVDQPQPHMLRNGSLPELHKTASFGSRSAQRLATLREHQPTGPLMCSEYWDGWFDSWGLYHHTTSAQDSAADLDVLLSTGASVNLYMFHGGTNFGFTNGANDKGVYQPIVTSYDYDAPLDEAGRPTAKYWAYREVISRYADVPEETPAATEPAAVVGESAQLTEFAPLVPAALGVLGQTSSTEVPSFSQVRHDAVFLVHCADVTRSQASVLTVGEVRDRVHVLVDGVCVGILSRELGQRTLPLPPIEGGLTLVVENQGRVNYGKRLGEDKGIIGGVYLDGAGVSEWTTTALAQDDPVTIAAGHLDWRPVTGAIPGLSLARGTFDAEQPRDRFLDTTGWGKGAVWVNGVCLGRYWSRPPQRTLYVPGPLVRAGGNDVVVLELDGAPDAAVRFAAELDLGPAEE